MIFAFDFPYKRDDRFFRPYDNKTEVKFNGLIDLSKDIYPYYGPAPPSLVDLCIKFKESCKILDSKSAIKSDEPFYYLLETQGPPEYWLGNKDGYENTLLSGVSKEIIESTKKGQCKIILWSANEGYDPLQYKIFDSIYRELANKSIAPKNKKKGIDKTIGGIILCEIKKNVMSLFFTNPALNVNLDRA